jgi:hypothetical protein
MAESTINFSIEGHKFNLCVTKFPTIFRLAPNGLHRPEVITDRTLVENELALRYVSRNYGTSHGLLPKYTIFNNIFYNTLTPKRCDRTNIWGSTRNLLLFILNDQSPLYISTFLWTEIMHMLNHGAHYVIYAPYIQRIINYKTEMEFGYDGKHGAYQPHIIRALVVPPPPPTDVIMGPSTAAHDSPPAGACSPLAACQHAPLEADELEAFSTTGAPARDAHFHGF